MCVVIVTRLCRYVVSCLRSTQVRNIDYTVFCYAGITNYLLVFMSSSTFCALNVYLLVAYVATLLAYIHVMCIFVFNVPSF